MGKEEMLAYIREGAGKCTVEELRKITDEWVANGATQVWIGQVVFLLAELDRAAKVVEAARKCVSRHWETEYGMPIASDEARALDAAVEEYDRG